MDGGEGEEEETFFTTLRFTFAATGVVLGSFSSCFFPSDFDTLLLLALLAALRRISFGGIDAEEVKEEEGGGGRITLRLLNVGMVDDNDGLSIAPAAAEEEEGDREARTESTSCFRICCFSCFSCFSCSRSRAAWDPSISARIPSN